MNLIYNNKKNIKEFIKKENTIVFIVLSALLIRIIFYIIVNPWDEQVIDKIILFSGSDCEFYHHRALDLLQSWSFVSLGAFYTPGYPLFLSIIYFLFGIKVWVVLFFQVLLNIGSLIIIFLLGKIIFTRSIAIISTVLYAIDPHAIFYSVTLLSDTLFVAIFLASILFLAYGLKNKRTIFFLISGFLLGLATLVRPVTQYFPFVIIGLILIYPKIKWFFRLKIIICFLLIFILAISPWLYRNYLKFNHLSLSSILGCNLLFFHVAFTEVDKTGNSIEEVRAELRKKAEEQGAIIGEDYKFDNFANSSIYKDVAVNYIKTNWKYHIQRHVKGIMNMYLNLGTKIISDHLGLKSSDLGFQYYASPNIFKMCVNFFKTKSTHEIIIGMLVGIFLFINYSTFIFGSFSMIYKKKYIYFMILIVIIYFSVLTGVIGLARYKLPIIPFYILISGYGLFEIYTVFKMKLQKRQSI